MGNVKKEFNWILSLIQLSNQRRQPVTKTSLLQEVDLTSVGRGWEEVLLQGVLGHGLLQPPSLHVLPPPLPLLPPPPPLPPASLAPIRGLRVKVWNRTVNTTKIIWGVLDKELPVQLPPNSIQTGGLQILHINFKLRMNFFVIHLTQYSAELMSFDVFFCFILFCQFFFTNYYLIEN